MLDNSQHIGIIITCFGYNLYTHKIIESKCEKNVRKICR